ncbi:hypothetical protein AKJ40_01980 [candidate division MSBL1 archaeon SCGC-AAA259M10]|uniref:Aldehyde oxidase/xanthine dehydrogenase a/b hammerhead domain-containing protein n=1 Tax=candidate division MSBL1 archaeon SCGC-AAA259M10 TaxID=1698270 RepID=A0A133V0R8_9EURY|nr:hypothetical protein AKJ40_01980 [candidate division MSBL1 archaeon SCGC-AAA259M10]
MVDKKDRENWSIVGQETRRTDAVRKVTGKAKYGFDTTSIVGKEFSDLLYVKILRSECAHGEIEKIDTSKAEEVEGVVKIFKHKNVPDVEYTSYAVSYPEPAPYDQKVLNEKVRFKGEPVAFVAAETKKAAEEAMEKIEIEYNELPIITDPEEALESDVEIHEGGNLIGGEIEIDIGEVDKALEESDVVIEKEYNTQIQKHGHLEFTTALAYYDRRGKLILETPSQVVFPLRRKLSEIIGVPENKLRVKPLEIGTGFGDFNDIGHEDLAVSLVTKETGRPAFICYNKEEQFNLTRRKLAGKFKVRLGSDKEGNINVIDLQAVTDSGAFSNHGQTVTTKVATNGLPMYIKNAENLRFTAKVAYTNKPPSGAFRTYGVDMGSFPRESAIDELAKELDMDPVELRIKNALREGQEDPISKVKVGKGRAIARTVRSCGFKDTLEKGSEKFGWKEKKKEDKEQEGSKKRGIGVASGMQETGVRGGELEACHIKLNDDGTIFITVGGSELGQGLETVASKIAAETVGVKLEDTDIISADTDNTMYSDGIYASGATYTMGNAVVEAAEELRDKIIEKAAEMMEKDPEELETGDSKVYVKGNEEESLTIKEVATDAFHGIRRNQLEGYGDAEDIAAPFSFATHFAEVEVDEDTYDVEVKRYVSVSDIGTPINPEEAEGQIEGQIAMGLGFALSEEMVFDDEGELQNPGLEDYKMLTALDVPNLETHFVETFEPTGPYGAKGAGEIGLLPVSPAIANAISDALGIEFRELPITKEKIMEKLNKNPD